MNNIELCRSSKMQNLFTELIYFMYFFVLLHVFPVHISLTACFSFVLLYQDTRDHQLQRVCVSVLQAERFS